MARRRTHEQWRTDSPVRRSNSSAAVEGAIFNILFFSVLFTFSMWFVTEAGKYLAQVEAGIQVQEIKK